MPYYHTVKTQTPSSLFRFGSEQGCQVIPVSLISGARDEFSSHTPTTDLRRGLILGKRTSDGRYGPRIRSTLSATEASGQTVLSVADPSIFNVGDNVYINSVAWDDEFDCGAITAVGASTITVTNALDTDYAGGSYVYLSNGLGVSKCILLENVTVVDSDANDYDGLDVNCLFQTYNASIYSANVPNFDARVYEEFNGSAAGEALINFGP